MDRAVQEGLTLYPHKFHVSISLPDFVEKYSYIPKDTILNETVSVAGRIQRKAASGSSLFFYFIHADGAQLQILADRKQYSNPDDFDRSYRDWETTYRDWGTVSQSRYRGGKQVSQSRYTFVFPSHDTCFPVTIPSQSIGSLSE